MKVAQFDSFAEGNFSLEQRDTERRARLPTRTAAEGHPVLSETDIKHGMESLKIHNENNSRKLMTNLRLKMEWQYMNTEPGSDEAGEEVRNSKDQPDATSVFTLLQNAT